jgi:hypothetical protein
MTQSACTSRQVCCVVLCCVAEMFYGQCLGHFQMQNIPTRYLYTVSATGLVGQLQRNIGGDIHIAEFFITPRSHTCTGLWERLVPYREGKQSARNNSVYKKVVFWTQCSGVHTKSVRRAARCCIDTGLQNFALRWLLPVSHANSTASLTGRLRTPCAVLWVATSSLGRSSWPSVHGRGSVYRWRYEQCTEFLLMGAWKSTRRWQNVIFCAVFFSVNVWCVRGS